MKKLLFLFSILFVMSCSTDDDNFNCDERIAEITKQYQTQIDWVYENTSPVDLDQVALIRAERDQMIAKACN